MTDFGTAPAALPRVAPLDPTKHVKYALGMVLGVDDFTQEFEYLSGRDKWLARDTIGYGTLWGLQLEIEPGGAQGPRINVAPGAALSPCGQFICVTPAQCAFLEEWLATNEQAVQDRLSASSPPGDSIALYVVLCYRECPTDDVPIPGEPCRSEDNLTAPSRLKDDFRLELRLDPPEQLEEDAVVDFVAWLRQVPIVDGLGTDLDAFLAELRAAARAAVEELESPSESPPQPRTVLDFLRGIPPASLAIPRARAYEYVVGAFRMWTTELRPALRRSVCACETGCQCTCHCDGDEAHGEECGCDSVLLARLDVDLHTATGGPAEATVDVSRRPYVVHLRLLQEWLLSGGVTWDRPCPGSPPSSPPGSPPGSPPEFTAVAETLDPGSDATATLDGTLFRFGIPRGDRGLTGATGATGAPGATGPQGPRGPEGRSFIVAAGRFGPFQPFSFGGLKVTPIPDTTDLFQVSFDGFNTDGRYILKGTALTGIGEPAHTIEIVPATDRQLRTLVRGTGLTPSKGLYVRARDFTGEGVAPAEGFELEISDYTDVIGL